MSQTGSTGTVASPVSPPARRLPRGRLFDARLLAGIALVLASVVVGARVFVGAAHTVAVWQAVADLAPGEQLTASMVQPVEVSLGAAQQFYVSAAHPLPVGYVVVRPVGRDELLPFAALAPAGASPDTRTVAVPVQVGHFDPGLGAGQVVDVYATPRTAGGSSASGPSRLVLAGATVSGRSGGSAAFTGDGSTVTVLLVVPAADVVTLVGAVESANIDLVEVPAGARAGSPPS
jgi:hypothetical protein